MTSHDPGLDLDHHRYKDFPLAMPRRHANITQADVARAIRAAKQAGAAEIEVHVGDRDKIVIRISPSTGKKITLEEPGEIIL
jgi:hypothetical protein